MHKIQWKRTVGVFLGGVALSVVVPILLEYLLQPDANQWIAKGLRTPANSAEWREIGPRLRAAAAISSYVIGPLAGLSVGLFAGLFERNRPAIVATSCLIPGFLQGLLADHARFWARSAYGVFHFVVQQALPFIVAALAATVCHRLMARNRSAGQV